MIGRISKSLAPLRRFLVTQAANRARDAGQFARAAELYGKALDDAPSRADLRVQRANMLKDCGRYEAADAEYRRALAQAPSDADFHLQFAHLLKVLGHRAEAIDHYRRAAELDPARGDADHELALAGEWDALARRFEAAPNRLPQAAVPVTYYDAFRRLWDIPPPPPDTPMAASVIIAMDEVPHEDLDRTIAALSRQSAARFQIALMGREPGRRDRAARLAAADARFEWIDADGDLPGVVRRMRHDLVVLPAGAAIFHEHALAWFGWAAARTEAAAFVCDTERLSGAGQDRHLHDPALRQAVDHEILLQANPFGETLALVRARCASELDIAGRSGARAKLALLLELAARGSVGHIPYPLVALPGRAADGGLASEDYADAVREHLRRRVAESAWRPPDIGAGSSRRDDVEPALVDVVIPTRDNGPDILAMARSLGRHAIDPGRLRLTVIDNGTTDPESLRALAELAAGGVDVHRCDEPFNWSRLSNLGARRGGGGILVFANDDMLMLTQGWDRLLCGLLARAEVGVVGAKLLYPDNTIQHAGILFGWGGGAIHDGLYEDRFAPGPGGRWQLRRRVSAVTGAFLGMRRDLFERVGGFDEQRLEVAYSDLDMALKVRRAGLAVLYAPEIELTHHESKSRGLTHLSEPAAARDAQERAVLRARWPGELDRDITVHPAWHAATLPFRLLTPPDRDACVAHLSRTASADSWRPVAPTEPT